MSSSKGEMITFRLDAVRHRQLEYLMSIYHYENKSHALREAVDLFIESKLERHGPKRITVELSEDAMRGVYELLELGAGNTQSIIIEKAVEAYVQERIAMIQRRESTYASLKTEFDRRRVEDKTHRMLLQEFEER